MTGFAAVDLGASSGRVLLVDVSDERLAARVVHRFPNTPVDLAGRLHWNILGLYEGILHGLRLVSRQRQPAAIGIDSWAVDYGLLDATGALLGNPLHYRDRGTDGVLAAVAAQHGADKIFASSGIALQPFNTLFQLVANRDAPQRGLARTFLMIPDLIAYWLTGVCANELTNASTTQLLDVTARSWSPTLLDLAGLDPAMLPTLLSPGDLIGSLRADVASAIRIATDTRVVAVGSHDTASAVVAAPMPAEGAAYISCGTWSLVGVELDQPVLSEAARRANFTNELGVDGTIRFLRNVMGQWLLQEAVRRWQGQPRPVSLRELLERAAEADGLRSVIDPDDPVFLSHGDMPERIRTWCLGTGQPAPETPVEIVRCIVDSLALAHARAVRSAAELSGRHVDVVHLVGGGSRNALLGQLTADATGLPVVAGPVEASALGNALVQARAMGAVTGDLTRLRGIVRATQSTQRYEPRAGHGRWAEAESRITGARS